MDVRYALNPVGSLVGRHVLVVEDDKDARDVFCAMLDYEGAMVLGTASAEEALAILRTVRPHVIVIDVVLDLRGAHDFAAAIARPPRADPRPDPEAGQTRQVPGDDPPFRFASSRDLAGAFSVLGERPGGRALARGASSARRQRPW